MQLHRPVVYLHEMKFPAQPQNPHAKRHIRQLLRSHGSGQYDQDSVDNHGHRNTDQKSDLVVAGHFVNQGINQILHSLKAHQGKDIYELFNTSRAYRNSISENRRGSVTPEYAFTVDIVDEPGAISTLSCILSARGISICNIGINHNREQGEGALKIVFYDEASMQQAWTQLKKYNYELIPKH